MGTLTLAFLALRCGGAGPPARVFDVEIAGGRLDLDPPLIRVDQGDDVLLRVQSAGAGEFHLHGYDLEVQLTPDEVAELSFGAGVIGRFDMELHTTGDVGQSQALSHDGVNVGCRARVPAGAPEPRLLLQAAPGLQPGTIEVSIGVENFALGTDDVAGVPSGHWHVFVFGDLVATGTGPRAMVRVDTPGQTDFQVSLADARHCAYDVQSFMSMFVLDASLPADNDAGRAQYLGALEVHPKSQTCGAKPLLIMSVDGFRTLLRACELFGREA